MVGLGWLGFTGVVLSLCSAVCHGAVELTTNFLSRPDIKAPLFDVRVNKLHPSDDALVFLGPYRAAQEGPCIYDMRGNLVWAGYELMTPTFCAHNVHVVDFKGAPHLAYTMSGRPSLFLPGVDVLLDAGYNPVLGLNFSDNVGFVDGHEFSIIENGTKAIMMGLKPTPWDLSSFGGPVDGSVVEYYFREVEISTRKVLFEWFCLDHIDPVESPADFSIPFDYFHLNSVEKDSDGNYIINAYLSEGTYKINGTDGSVIWRLGGNRNDFKMLPGFNTTHKHHVRIQDFKNVRMPPNLANVSMKTHLALTMFDNAMRPWVTPTGPESAGIVVLLDFEAMTVELLERYPIPGSDYAIREGNMQLLSNGDRFIGWGVHPTLSQFSNDGNLIWDARFSEMPINSYRTFRQNWTGHPTTHPDLFSYSWTCSWNTVMYASWNGATEVHEWRFRGGKSPDGPFEILAVVPKEGFETSGWAQKFTPYTVVEALGVDKKVLGRSKVVMTTVPVPQIAQDCDRHRCEFGTDYPNADMSHLCRGAAEIPQKGLANGNTGQQVVVLSESSRNRS